MPSIAELELLARQTRRDALRMIHTAASGHPGGALSCADYLVALYHHTMLYDPAQFNTDGKGEDIFFLSNGHVSAAWYSVLARAGFFPIAELATFRKLGGRLQGHPTPAEGLPGVRIASGSLGQGLSVACGAAIGKRLLGDPRYVFSLHGDGELQEGQIWEAALFAAAHKIDNLIAAIDYNRVQIDGPTDLVISLGDLKAKWEAFGWHVMECNGHDMKGITDTLSQAKQATGKGRPIVILLHTRMGHGVSFMDNDYRWHGKAPNSSEIEQALKELGTTTLRDY